jgi:hypothetical protein
MKLVYKPFSLFAHQLAGRLGKSAFAAIWQKVGSGEGPPAPTAGRLSLTSVAGSAAREAATMAATTAVIEQLTARAFHHLLGAWPQKTKMKPPVSSGDA